MKGILDFHQHPTVFGGVFGFLVEWRRHKDVVVGVLEDHVFVKLDIELVRIKVTRLVGRLGTQSHRRVSVLGASRGEALLGTTHNKQHQC